MFHVILYHDTIPYISVLDYNQHTSMNFLVFIPGLSSMGSRHNEQ